jgi:hypothetical protein
VNLPSRLVQWQQKTRRLRSWPTRWRVCRSHSLGDLSLRCNASRKRPNAFLRNGPTPLSTFQLEAQLDGVLREAGRQTLEYACNAAEPPDEPHPPRLRRGRREFRRNRRTPNTIATRFGSIVLERMFYQSVEPGERGLAPLERRLGVVAGLATPALADEAARLNADLTQHETLAALKRHYGVHWSPGTLRRVVQAMAQHYAPWRHEAQVDRLLELLEKADKSRGKHAPTLSGGRDGVIIPMRPCWEEASTATVSVLDRRGRRLGTVYLGRMPQPGQKTMTAQLLALIGDVLQRWNGKTPRLVYVTDAGTHPQDFLRYQLQGMKHPRTGERLEWEWIVDYYHACERITKLAEALFGSGPEASRWASEQRRVLRDERGGVTRVVQRAQGLRRHRSLQRTRKEFDTALGYLKKYASHMDYAGARRRGLPIGSGVTEAACKTIFGYRFKQSGMRWKREHGQHVLDLRVILKSGVWETCRTRWLAAYAPVETVTSRVMPRPTRKVPGDYALSA